MARAQCPLCRDLAEHHHTRGNTLGNATPVLPERATDADNEAHAACRRSALIATVRVRSGHQSSAILAKLRESGAFESVAALGPVQAE